MNFAGFGIDLGRILESKRGKFTLLVTFWDHFGFLWAPLAPLWPIRGHFEAPLLRICGPIRVLMRFGRILGSPGGSPKGVGGVGAGSSGSVVITHFGSKSDGFTEVLAHLALLQYL